jgi:hypothetical protein
MKRRKRREKGNSVFDLAICAECQGWVLGISLITRSAMHVEKTLEPPILKRKTH